MPTYVPSQCWCEAISRGPPPLHDRCMTRPNCRGRGHAIAAWNHLDMDLITQQDAQGHAYGLSQLAQKPLQQATKHSPSVSGIDSNTWLQIPRSRPHVAVNDMCTPTSAARCRKVYDATALTQECRARHFSSMSIMTLLMCSSPAHSVMQTSGHSNRRPSEANLQRQATWVDHCRMADPSFM